MLISVKVARRYHEDMLFPAYMWEDRSRLELSAEVAAGFEGDPLDIMVIVERFGPREWFRVTERAVAGHNRQLFVLGQTPKHDSAGGGAW